MHHSGTHIVFGLYLLLMLVIGELCARYRVKSLDDYLVAGRRHGVLITSGSIAATVVGAGSTIGAVGGWDVFALGNTVIAWIIMSTTWHFAMQSTAQRILSSRTQKTAKYGCLMASGMLLPLAMLVGLTGMAARVLYPGLLPASGISQGEALPALIKGIMPPLIGGIILGALVAVIMSTCDTILLGASTMFVKDIYQRLLRGTAANHALIRISKWVTLVIGTVAIVSALIAPALIRILEITAAVYCVALFVPIVLGIYWEKANQSGAIAGMATSSFGGVLWRAWGWEQATGIHMLNVSLPLAFVTMVIVCLMGTKE